MSAIIDSLLRNAQETKEVRSGGSLDLLIRQLVRELDSTKSILTWGASSLDLVAAARRFWPGSSSDPADAALLGWIAPCAGKLTGLTYRCQAGGDIGALISYRFVKNGLAQTAPENPQLVDVPAQNTFAQVFLGVVSVAAGDVVALECVKAAPVAVAPTGVLLASSFTREL